MSSPIFFQQVWQKRNWTLREAHCKQPTQASRENSRPAEGQLERWTDHARTARRGTGWAMGPGHCGQKTDLPLCKRRVLRIRHPAWPARHHAGPGLALHRRSAPGENGSPVASFYRSRTIPLRLSPFASRRARPMAMRPQTPWNSLRPSRWPNPIAEPCRGADRCVNCLPRDCGPTQDLVAAQHRHGRDHRYR